MKLPIQQLTQHLNKSLATIYVVSGDEPLLVDEALHSIREAALQQGFSERVRIQAGSSAEWGNTFYANAQSLSLFASKRLLELDLTQAKLSAATSKILQEYAQQPTTDTLLLIRTNKLDSKTEQSSWYKALDKVGIFISVWPITIDQLPTWIIQRAKKLNLNITSTAAERLADLVEGNLLAASQEIEKLRLIQLSDTIDPTTIENIVSDHAHFDIFALVESALAGNLKRSIRILNNLAAEDTEPTLILWALTRELRTLSELAEQMQKGVSLTALFPKFRIWEKRQAPVRAFLQRHKQSSCYDFIAQAASIDRLIKGADIGNVWDSLGKLVKVISA